MGCLFEQNYNNKIGAAYQEMLLIEAINNKKAAKLISAWEKKYLKDSKDKKKVKASLNTIINLLSKDMDNILLMDELIQEFLKISKYVSDEASAEISKVLEVI